MKKCGSSWRSENVSQYNGGSINRGAWLAPCGSYQTAKTLYRKQNAHQSMRRQSAWLRNDASKRLTSAIGMTRIVARRNENRDNRMAPRLPTPPLCAYTVPARKYLWRRSVKRKVIERKQWLAEEAYLWRRPGVAAW